MGSPLKSFGWEGRGKRVVRSHLDDYTKETSNCPDIVKILIKRRKIKLKKTFLTLH